MKRIHLFEFEDQAWFPSLIREGMMDYLRFMMNFVKAYQPAVPLIRNLMARAGTRRIIDLCSGGGGDILTIYKEAGDAEILLTDKYPNLAAFEQLSEQSGGKIGFVKDSVDAREVPGELKGLRTIFTAFHHFSPREALQVMDDAVRKKSPIAVFEGSGRSLLGSLLVVLLVLPLAFLVCPFIRPFRLSRLVFTYLVPVIPVCTAWDGFVSFMRLYTPSELTALARRASSENYVWKAGTVKHRRYGFNIVYLLGYPSA